MTPFLAAECERANARQSACRSSPPPGTPLRGGACHERGAAAHHPLPVAARGFRACIGPNRAEARGWNPYLTWIGADSCATRASSVVWRKVSAPVELV